MKYSKNQQDYINSVGGALAHPSALATIGKQDMTIAHLLGVLRLTLSSLESINVNPLTSPKGPRVQSVIETAIVDAEKNGLRVVGSSQLVEVLMDIAQYTGEGPYTTPWQDIVRDISQKARKVLGIKETDGILSPKPEYQTIVYY